MLDRADEITSINVVTGECNDSKLNSIRRRFVTTEHAREALDLASECPSAEGAIGAGKGMVCFGYKGGIGCSSRLVPSEGGEFRVGVLVLSNFGKQEEFKYAECGSGAALDNKEHLSDGSIMIIMATDAPLSDRQLKRVSKRCAIGLGRTGGHWGHGSGDVIIAFSTAQKISHAPNSFTESITQLREDNEIFNKLFQAAAEATEEAILNSLAQAKTTTGHKGKTIYGFEWKSRE